MICGQLSALYLVIGKVDKARQIRNASGGTDLQMEGLTLYKEGKLGVNQIAKQLGIAKNTLYKYLKYRNVKINGYKSVAPKGNGHGKTLST
jgi:DNA-binding CsgD family transcriptional regulator